MGYIFTKEGQNWLILVLMVLIRPLTTVNSPKDPPVSSLGTNPNPTPKFPV